MRMELGGFFLHSGIADPSWARSTVVLLLNQEFEWIVTALTSV